LPEKIQKLPQHIPIILPQLGNQLAEVYVVIHDARSPRDTTLDAEQGFDGLEKPQWPLAARRIINRHTQ
jgi:hypothetical protein